MLLEYVRKKYRASIEHTLWKILIIASILGAILGMALGYVAGRDLGVFIAVIGLVIGLIIGIFVGESIMISYGGKIVTFVEMAENLSLIRNELYSLNGKEPPTNVDVAPESIGVILGEWLKSKSSTKSSSPITRQPTIVPEGTITQAKCRNCAKMLACEKSFADEEKSFDESSCCGKHEFFRG